MRRILKCRVSPLAGDVLISDHEAARAGRAVFYDALADSMPHVVEDLDSSCRDVLRQTDRVRLAHAPPAMLSQVEPIGSCVETWAKRYHLDRTWVVEDAIESFLEAEDSGGRLRLAPHGIGSRNAVPIGALGTVSLTFAWRFDSQPRPAFKKLMLGSLERQLDAELDRIAADALASGAARQRKPTIVQAMRWLAWQVVNRWPAWKIAAADPEAPGERAIQEALKDVSALIDLPLPELRGAAGRKRPSRKHPPRTVKRQRHSLK